MRLCTYSKVLLVDITCNREYCGLIDLTCESTASSEDEPDIQAPMVATDLQ